MTPRRFAAPLALTALAALTVGACSNPDPAVAPTGSASASPAATSAPVERTPEPTASVVTDDALDLSGLPDAARAYATFIGDRNFVEAGGFVCAAIRGKDAASWAKTQEKSPQVYLELAEVNPEGFADSFAQAEFPQPGEDTTADAAVLFDVTPGSEFPNPTMLTRWVHTGDGWKFCGSAPNA